LFSSLWTSAIGISELQSYSAGSDSPSILESEELLSGRGVSLEHPLAARSDSGGRVSGNGWNADRLSLLHNGGLLTQRPVIQPSATSQLPAASVVAGDTATEADAAVIATIRDSLNRTSAAIAGSEVEAPLVSHTPGQNFAVSNRSGTIQESQALRHDASKDAASLLPGLILESSAAVHSPEHNGVRISAKAPSETDRLERGGEPSDPTRHEMPSSAANALAAPAGVDKSPAPGVAAHGVASRPTVPHGDSVPGMPHGSTGMASVDPSTTRAVLPTPAQSAIAFQAEIRLNNSQSTSDAPLPKPQPDARARWTHAPGQ
jgi:hypothetical protein